MTVFPDLLRVRTARLKRGTRASFVERASEIAERRSVELVDFVGEVAGDVVGKGARLKLSSVGVSAVEREGTLGGIVRVGGVDGRTGWGSERGMLSGVGTRRGMRSTAA